MVNSRQGIHAHRERRTPGPRSHDRQGESVYLAYVPATATKRCSPIRSRGGDRAGFTRCKGPFLRTRVGEGEIGTVPRIEAPLAAQLTGHSTGDARTLQRTGIHDKATSRHWRWRADPPSDLQNPARATPGRGHNSWKKPGGAPSTDSTSSWATGHESPARTHTPAGPRCDRSR